MKKVLVSLILLFIFTAAIFKHQSEIIKLVTGYELTPPGKGDFLLDKPVPMNTIEGADIQDDVLRIYSTSMRLGMIIYGSFGNGNKYSPIVHVNAFDLKTGKAYTENYPVYVTDITGKPTTDYTFVNGISKGDIQPSSKDFRWNDIQAKYPNAHPTPFTEVIKDAPFLDAYIGLGKYSIQRYVPTRQLSAGVWVSKNELTYPVMQRPAFEGEYKESPWGVAKYNDKEQNITVVVGANRKDFKNQFYKEFAYVTHDQTGHIINQVNMKFDYVKDHEYVDVVPNIDKGTKQLVAILGRRLFMGKQNDPELHKFHLVALNPDGSQMIFKEFIYGEKDTEFLPVYAYVKDDKVFVISRNNAAASLETFIFDKQGNMTKQAITASDLNAITYGDKAGAFGFTAGALKVSQIDMKTLPSGNMLIVSDVVQTEKITNPDPAAVGTTNAYLEVPRYRMVHVLEVTAEGIVKGQYVVNKNFTTVSIPTQIESLIIKDDKLIILAVDIISFQRDPSKFNITDQKTFLTVGSEGNCKPAVFVLNTKDKTIDVHKPSDPLFSTLYGTGSYFLANDKSNIVYFGIKDDKVPEAVEYQVYKFIF